MPLEIGSLMHHDRYLIEALLGQGGMGAVYKAHDNSLDKSVAIKENLETSPEAQKQFNREANILSNLSHPNLPRVTDYFIIPGQGQYLVMDYVEGEDLHSMLARLGRLPEERVLIWIGQISDALAYLHSQNPPIIHRDIKPSNIRIHADGRAMLVDFGIAKLFTPQMATTVGAKMITPGYSPPEQYGGGTDTRSDIYALGATLFHLLTGQEPPESVMRVVNNAIMPTPHEINPEISPQVEQVIIKSVELATERRYQSASELNADLKRSTQPPLRPAPAVAVVQDPNATRVVDQEKASIVQAGQADADVTDAYATRSVAQEKLPTVQPPVPSSPAVQERKKIPLWVWIGGGVIACLGLVVLVIVIGGLALGGQPEPTRQAILLPTTTSIPTLPPPTATNQPATVALVVQPTVAASPTPDNRPPNTYTPVADLVIPDGQLIRSVEEKDGYVYVLTKAARLYVFDLRELSTQQAFTVFDKPLTDLTLQNGNGLLRQGDTLYAFGHIGYQVIDIQDAANPILKSAEKGTPIYNMMLQEDLMVVTGEEKVIVYDASNPPNLRQISLIITGPGTSNFAAALYQDRLYVSQYSTVGNKTHGLLMVYDYKNSVENLKLIQRIDARELAYHLKVIDNRLLRCCINDVEVWDLSLKDKPDFESSQRAQGQGRVCALDRSNLLTNGTAFTWSGNTLLPLLNFDAQAGAGDIPPDQLSQTESYPYGSVVTSQYVFLAQSGRVLVLASEVK